MQVAIIRAANRDGRGGKIAQNIRTSQGCHCAGWIRRPEILANLNAKSEARYVASRKNLIGAELHFLIADCDPSISYACLLYTSDAADE